MDYMSSFDIVAFKVTVDSTVFQFYVVNASTYCCYCNVAKKSRHNNNCHQAKANNCSKVYRVIIFILVGLISLFIQINT